MFIVREYTTPVSFKCMLVDFPTVQTFHIMEINGSKVGKYLKKSKTV